MHEFEAVREQTVRLCAPLEPEDYQVQPFEWVSPPKWHLGHTTWFFETFCLRKYFDDVDVFDPRFHFIFNSYYESQGEHIPQGRRGTLSRPTLDEVRAYRHHVDGRMQEAAAAMENRPEREEWRKVKRLGLEHEKQHQELLLMDIKSILFSQVGHPAYSAAEAFADSSWPKNVEVWDDIPGGVYELGASEGEFAFDNEGSRHKVLLTDFRLRKQLVNNGEYLEFMTDGGYSRPELWLSDGWRWRQQNRIAHPLYWMKRDEEWFEYTLGGLQPLQARRPVAHVSYYEAEAFARWKGLRLPTEAEWEAACAQEPRSYLWAWTQSAYLPYPGYNPFPGGFAEYNGKFMCGQMVLRGGCFATPPDHYRPSYRNFFYPEQRWQFSGIRLAQ